VWKLKQWIGRIADKLNAYELKTHAFLHKAPENIDISQQEIHNLRQENQKLQVQIQEIRQIISLLSLAKGFSHRFFGRIEWISTKKPSLNKSNISH
jgi:hypothetical protein